MALPAVPQGATLQLAILDDERFAQLNHLNAVPLGKEAVTLADPIRLKAGASVSGRIVYGDTGKPVAGAVLMAQGIDAARGAGWGLATSGTDDAYRPAGAVPVQSGAGASPLIYMRTRMASRWG